MFLSNFAEKCSLISSSITEGSIEGQKRCYEEFCGQWCQHNWNPLLFLRDNSVHYPADKFYCDVIPGKSCERMAVRVTTTASFTVSNGGGVLRSRPGCQHSQTGTVERLYLVSAHAPAPAPAPTHRLRQTTDSPPLQNNQSKSLPDNWSVHCWRHRHSLEWGWSLVQRYSRDYLIGCEC